MDWKQEAIDKLKGYEAQRRSMEDIPRELERLGAAYTNIRAARIDGMPKAGCSPSGREDAMLSNIVHQDELKRRLKEIRLWVEIVDGGVVCSGRGGTADAGVLLHLQGQRLHQ